MSPYQPVVGTTVGVGVVVRVESNRSPSGGEAALRVRLLGPLTVTRAGIDLALPPSRKVRALLVYLALAPRPVPRDRLCELLWSEASDPRSELRWSLSKMRALVDSAGRQRLDASGDAVQIDLSDGVVDAFEVAQAMQQGVATIDVERLRALAAMFAGELAEGLEIDASPTFGGWLTAQRRRFRGCQTALLEQLTNVVDDDEAFVHLDKWLQLAPFDVAVHDRLLRALARHGRIREGEEHLAAAVRLFESEGLDCASLRSAWRTARGEEQKVAASAPPLAAGSTHRDAVVDTARRASIAVMPFVDLDTEATTQGGLAGALAHDIITRIAKLRSLFVIAQGTVFALHARRIGPEEAGRMLNVDYVASGSVRRQGERLTVAVELTETRSARVVWAETLSDKLDDTLAVLDAVGNRIVSSIDAEIEMLERNRAVLKPPSSLDAWEAYHRGLWHMYRFDRADNERARHFFETAVRLDPTFARAYAGLSFTHFQNAFQGWAKREPAIDRAFDTAGQSLMADDRDPAAHWAMGRALWLRRRHDESVVELERAIDLSPNFALGHYTLAFVHSQAGDAAAAVSYSDHSRELSPFDPLLFGMLGARAMALIRLGRFDEAAEWGVKAAARPNAHAHIQAIAALSLALAGRVDETRVHVAAIRRTAPDYRVADFLTAMHFAPDDEKLFRRGARLIGLD